MFPEKIQKEAQRRHPKQNRFLSTWSSSSFTPSSLCQSKRFILSYGFGCLWDLILSVATQSSWPKVSVGAWLETFALLTQLPLHHNGTVKCLDYCWYWDKPCVHLTPTLHPWTRPQNYWSPWLGTAPHLQPEGSKFTFFKQRTMALDLELLTFIQAPSHMAVDHPSAGWKLWIDEVNRSMSFAKSKVAFAVPHPGWELRSCQWISQTGSKTKANLDRVQRPMSMFEY